MADGGVQRGGFARMRHTNQTHTAVRKRGDDTVGRIGRSIRDNHDVEQIRRVVETQQVLEFLADEFLPVVDRQQYRNGGAEIEVLADGRAEAPPSRQKQGIAHKT